MKILFIYKYAILGGVTTQLVNRLSIFKNNFECHFAFLNDYGGISAFNNYPHAYILKNSDEFKSLLNANKYDILSIIDTNEVYYWLESTNFNGFIINEVHTTTSNIDKLIELKDNKMINLILTPSNYMKTLIENTYNFNANIPVEVLPNCLDFSKFYFDNSQVSTLKNTVLWIGKLDNHKRWYDFLDLCNKLNQEYKSQNFNYIIVGGITAPNSTVNLLLKKLMDFKLVEKTIWYPSIQYSDMYKIYSRVKSSGGVYVSTTKDESFGMTVLESMSIGLPCVVPNLGALPELFNKDIKSKFLYTPKNLNMACKLIIDNLNTSPQFDLSNYTPSETLKKFKYILNKYNNKEY
jgi:glycosyltransferase involved in cell wall biosynthesis